MRGFVQRIQGQPTPGVIDGLLDLGARHQGPHQTLERTRKLAPQPLRLEELPLVEGGAVAQREPGHEVTPKERGGLLERCHALGTDVVAVVPMAAAAPLQLGEALDVDPDVVALQGDRRSPCRQPPPTQRLLEHRQSAPQRSPGPFLVVLGPQEPRERIASLRPSRDREVDEQRRGLASVDLDGSSVGLDLRRSQHGEPETPLG